MNLTSRTLEGRKWEEQFKKLTARFFRQKQILYKATVNFGLETCPECEELKKINEDCKECGAC